MKQVRIGVFETNSSSSHAICIHRKQFVSPDQFVLPADLKLNN